MQRLTRLRDVPAPVADALLALLVLVTGLAALVPNHPELPGLSYAAAVVTSGAVAFRRSHPWSAVVVALTAFAIHAVVVGHHVDNSATLLAVLVLMYSLGRHADTRRIAAAVPVMLFAFASNAYYGTDGFVNEFAFDLLVATALPVAAGIVLRRRSALVAELQAQRGELERERDARARDAAIAERVRIARELHDVVVHDVSEMVVQAAAAREIVRDQPQAAAEVIAKVEGAGRGALDELRRALGVLRSDDRGMALEPQPTLSGLRALVGRAGGQVDLELDAALERLPADLQLTVYRIVEDILAEGVGDPGRGEVRVGRDAHAVTVEVRHGGPPPGAAGLGAMRQRVEIFDGELDIAADERTGSRVWARLPVPVTVTG
jgi:signal transduction histidine kinase